MPLLTLPENGGSLYYETYGEKRNPAIVFVNGFCITTAWWKKQLPLQEQFYLVVFDARGVGSSQAPEPFAADIRFCASDLACLLEALDVRDATLVGWSMGGPVVLSYYYAFQAARVSRLVLIDSSPCMRQQDDWEHGYTPKDFEQFLFLLKEHPELFFETFGATLFAQPPSEEERVFLTAELRRTSPAVAFSLLQDVFGHDYRPLFQFVRHPMLLVAGTRSAVFPVEGSRWMQQAVTQAELALFEECGHALFYENASLFNSLLTNFVLDPLRVPSSAE